MTAKAKTVVENEEEIIAKALRRMRAKKPQGRVPGDKVRVFLAKVGEELKNNKKLSKTRVNNLVRQLKSGKL